MTCEACSGSGVCDACSGYGFFPDSPETDYSGTDCVVCDGTCECADCDGDGATENDRNGEKDTEFNIDYEGADVVALEMRQ